MDEPMGQVLNGEQVEAVPEVVLIIDSPSETDEFEAKAHDNVAKAIASIVETEPTGIVIGLEGSWGSGKSTVVQLIRSHLDETKTRMFVFDAWVHQGDPLRRSFLETLIAELEQAKWLPRSAAIDSLGQISGKKTTLHTTSSAKLTREGIYVSLGTAFVPIGAVLASNRFSVFHRPALFVGLPLLLGPLLVMGILGLLRLIGRRMGGQKTSNWRHAWAELKPLSFFAKTQDVMTITNGIEQGNPTSVEFEKVFTDVLVKSVYGSRRLLIVMDNLDRVDAADAKTLLTTLQTFMGPANPVPISKTSNVWILIPYDPDGLDRLWRTGPLVQSQPKDGDQHAPKTTSASAAFVEKIFQVRFEAPPLVLSDWREYLIKLLAKALPGSGAQELKTVLRLRALYPGAEPDRNVSNESPTPRQLKQFVNQIGTIRRQQSDIPLIDIAYYVLLRHDRVEIAEKLRTGELPHSSLNHLFNADIVKSLAALYFGTNRNLGQQLLLKGALENALARNDATALSELKSRSGFEHVLTSLDVERWTEDGGIELTGTVATLEAADVFKMTDAAEWMKAILLPLARSVPEWSLAGRECGVGLALLFDHLSPNDAALAELLTKIEATPRPADTEGQLQLEGLAGFADTLTGRRGFAEFAGVPITIPLERLSASLAFFGSKTTKSDSRAFLRISYSPAQVADSVLETATTGNFIDVPSAIDVLQATPGGIDFAALGRGSVTWLQGNNPTSAAQLDTLLKCIDISRQTVGNEEFLSTAADNGTFMRVTSFAEQNSLTAQSADALMLHLIAKPSPIAPSPATPQAAQGAQVANVWLSNPSSYPDIMTAQLNWLKNHSEEAFEFLLSPAMRSSFPEWVKYQLVAILEPLELTVTADQYLRDWRYLLEVLSLNQFDKLTQNIFENSERWSLIINASSDPELALSAMRAVSPESKKWFDVQTWAERIVKNQSESIWTSSLSKQNSDSLLNLALALSENAEAPLDPQGLASALLTHSKALAEGTQAWQPDAATFTKLTNLLSPSVKSTKASEIAANLEGTNGTVKPEFLSTYGEFLAGEETFRKHQKLPNFIERAVAKNEWNTVAWIVSIAQKHSDMFLPHGRKVEMESLKIGVKQKKEEFDAEDREKPEELLALLKLLDL